MKVENENDTFVVIAAVRYALKDQHYGSYEVAKAVKQVWKNLSHNDQAVIRREIREAMTRSRLGGPKFEVHPWMDILNLTMKK